MPTAEGQDVDSSQSSKTTAISSNRDHANKNAEPTSEDEAAIESHSQNELSGENFSESTGCVEDDVEEVGHFEAGEKRVLTEENVVAKRRNETDEPANSHVKSGKQSVKLKYS